MAGRPRHGIRPVRPRLLPAHPGANVCFGGDAAAFDTGGYLWFSSRAGEIIKIAGHRLGTIEAETAFPRHPPPPKPG